MNDYGESTPGASLDDDIFSVVPWSIGKAHTGALRLALREKELAEKLSEYPGLESLASINPDSLRTEWRLGERIADLGFETAKGVVAVETKVEDPVDFGQVAGYDAAHSILFLPGGSGEMWKATFGDENPYIDGERFLSALDGEPLGPMLSRYRTALACETERFRFARQAWLDGKVPTCPDREWGRGTSGRMVKQTSWLRLVFESLSDSANDLLQELLVRTEANDWGFYLGATRVDLSPLKGGAYIDVIASIRSDERSIRIKVDAGGEPGCGDQYDEAMRRLGDLKAWEPGRRRVSGRTVTVLKAFPERPSEAAELVKSAHRRLAEASDS